jgi:hypothetical protein
MIILPEDMSSSSVLSRVRVARSLVFCIMLSVLRFKDSYYSSGGHEFILGSKWGLCRSISCLLYDAVCPLIILLISSNFSNIYLPRSYKALDLVCFRFFFCSLMFDI